MNGLFFLFVDFSVWAIPSNLAIVLEQTSGLQIVIPRYPTKNAYNLLLHSTALQPWARRQFGNKSLHTAVNKSAVFHLSSFKFLCKCHLLLSTCYPEVLGSCLRSSTEHGHLCFDSAQLFHQSFSFLSLQISMHSSKYSSPWYRKVCFFFPYYPWIHSTRQESKLITGMAKNIKGLQCGFTMNADGWLQISTKPEFDSPRQNVYQENLQTYEGQQSDFL